MFRDLKLQWRHNGHNGVSSHQPCDCLLNRLFRLRSKKTSKLRVTGLCAGNSPGTDEFPAQMASNEENVAIWRRHHEHNLSGLDQTSECFKSAFEFLYLRAFQISTLCKDNNFQCMETIFYMEFQSTIWNFPQNILPIYSKMRVFLSCLFNIS